MKEFCDLFHLTFYWHRSDNNGSVSHETMSHDANARELLLFSIEKEMKQSEKEMNILVKQLLTV